MTKRPPQVHVRIPEVLKKKIEESAEANGNSINTEIVKRLKYSFREDPSPVFISFDSLDKETQEKIINNLNKNK